MLEKLLEEEFRTLLRDMLKQITNTWKIVTLKNRQIHIVP